MTLKIINVVGFRTNLMKIAPIVEAMQNYPDVQQLLLHTGQHYDERISKIFFEELGIPQPDIYLGIDSTQPVKIAQGMRTMIEQSMPSNFNPQQSLAFAKKNSAEQYASTIFKNLC